MMHTRRLCALLSFLALTISAVPQDLRPSPDIGKDIGVDQKLKAQLPLSAKFRNEADQEVTLGTYFNARPVVMSLVYYECPSLCNEILNGLLATLRAVKFDVGTEFDVVVISIDPKETPVLASKKKQSYIKSYNRAGSEAGWHFLTGSEADIKAVADAVGYRYMYDPKTKLYAHGAAIWTATPKGKVSQYFFGIEYPARDLQFALIESSQNKIGSIIDQALLYCFVYDPSTGKYGFVIMRVLRIAGILTVIALGTFILTMVRRERGRKSPLSEFTPAPEGKEEAHDS